MQQKLHFFSRKHDNNRKCTVKPRCFILLQDYILAVPDDSYSPSLIKEKPMDKSLVFINQCGTNSFYIKYV